MTITGRTRVFHRTEPSRIVVSQDELTALGEGWADTPAAFYEPAPAPKRPTKTKGER